MFHQGENQSGTPYSRQSTPQHFHLVENQGEREQRFHLVSHQAEIGFSIAPPPCGIPVHRLVSHLVEMLFCHFHQVENQSDLGIA